MRHTCSRCLRRPGATGDQFVIDMDTMIGECAPIAVKTKARRQIAQIAIDVPDSAMPLSDQVARRLIGTTPIVVGNRAEAKTLGAGLLDTDARYARGDNSFEQCISMRRFLSQTNHDAVDSLKNVDGVRFIRLTSQDVVRHDLVTRIVEAYDARDKKAKA